MNKHILSTEPGTRICWPVVWLQLGVLGLAILAVLLTA